jgi:hypothetical protein
MAQNSPRGTPARVLIIFSLLAGAVVVSALRDSRLANSGRVRYPTAVGDISYYTPGSSPLQIAVHGSVFVLNEESGERLRLRDDLMFRVPLAVPEPRLYTSTSSFREDEVPPLYLKVADGEYVRVELRAAESGEAAKR